MTGLTPTNGRPEEEQDICLICVLYRKQLCIQRKHFYHNVETISKVLLLLFILFIIIIIINYNNGSDSQRRC